MSLVMIKTNNEVIQVASDFDSLSKPLYLGPKYVRALFKLASLKHNIFIKPKHWKIFVGRNYQSVQEIERVVKRYKVFGDLGY
ncbi:MAG: hypothetical protein AB8G05_05500 [Oligoflexales bacterium]